MTLSQVLTQQTSNGQLTPTAQAIFSVLAVARKALAKWQPRLRLNDWDIWVEIGALDSPHWAAQSNKEWRMRRARIILPDDYIRRMRDRGENPPGASDADLVEDTVIHELLHILEEPLASRVNDEIGWYVGTSNDSAGVMGAELRNGWRDYREWWINHMVRMLLEAYAGR